MTDDRPSGLDRVAYVLMVFISAGTLLGWMLGAVVMVRLERLTAKIMVIEAQLQPMAPVDVFCGVNQHVRQLYELMAQHCATNHATQVPAFQMPRVCAKRDLAPVE